MPSKTRPTGVTILAALQALGGFIWLLAGAGMMMVGALLPIPFELPTFFGPITGLMGIIFLVFGVVALILAYGVFTGRRWAWLWTLVFAFIGILLGLLGAVGSLESVIVPIIIYVIIIYYLTRPHVKAFFGK